MNDKIKISRIEINIGKKTLSLTLAEMKELKAVLDETFPEETIRYIHSPAPEPIIIDRPVWPRPHWPRPLWEITCGPSVMCLSRTRIEG